MTLPIKYKPRRYPRGPNPSMAEWDEIGRGHQWADVAPSDTGAREEFARRNSRVIFDSDKRYQAELDKVLEIWGIPDHPELLPQLQADYVFKHLGIDPKDTLQGRVGRTVHESADAIDPELLEAAAKEEIRDLDSGEIKNLSGFGKVFLEEVRYGYARGQNIVREGKRETTGGGIYQDQLKRSFSGRPLKSILSENPKGFPFGNPAPDTVIGLNVGVIEDPTKVMMGAEKIKKDKAGVPLEGQVDPAFRPEAVRVEGPLRKEIEAEEGKLGPGTLIEVGSTPVEVAGMRRAHFSPPVEAARLKEFKARWALPEGATHTDMKQLAREDPVFYDAYFALLRPPEGATPTMVVDSRHTGARPKKGEPTGSTVLLRAEAGAQSMPYESLIGIYDRQGAEIKKLAAAAKTQPDPRISAALTKKQREQAETFRRLEDLQKIDSPDRDENQLLAPIKTSASFKKGVRGLEDLTSFESKAVYNTDGNPDAGLVGDIGSRPIDGKLEGVGFNSNPSKIRNPPVWRQDPDAIGDAPQGYWGAAGLPGPHEGQSDLRLRQPENNSGASSAKPDRSRYGLNRARPFGPKERVPLAGEASRVAVAVDKDILDILDKKSAVLTEEVSASLDEVDAILLPMVAKMRAQRARFGEYQLGKGLWNQFEVAYEATRAPAGHKRSLQKQNIFTVKPIQSVDKKAIVKASVANKYIGFGEGIAGSSTESYRQQVGEYANTGNYSPNDVIFVSIGGKRGTKEQQKTQQDRTINEALKAIGTGATLITDNKAYVKSNSYNTGEARLAKNLEAKGYNYSEQPIDGQVLGVWNKPARSTAAQVRALESISDVSQQEFARAMNESPKLQKAVQKAVAMEGVSDLGTREALIQPKEYGEVTDKVTGKREVAEIERAESIRKFQEDRAAAMRESDEENMSASERDELTSDPDETGWEEGIDGFTEAEQRSEFMGGLSKSAGDDIGTLGNKSFEKEGVDDFFAKHGPELDKLEQDTSNLESGAGKETMRLEMGTRGENVDRFVGTVDADIDPETLKGVAVDAVGPLTGQRAKLNPSGKRVLGDRNTELGVAKRESLNKAGFDRVDAGVKRDRVRESFSNLGLSAKQVNSVGRAELETLAEALGEVGLTIEPLKTLKLADLLGQWRRGVEGAAEKMVQLVKDNPKLASAITGMLAAEGYSEMDAVDNMPGPMLGLNAGNFGT